VFHHYWTVLQDISQEDLLRDVAIACGIDPDEYFEKIASQPYKDKLKHTTQELIDRGGFGSPTMFLNGDDMYFGNDRLPLVEAKLNA
jgi:2-hydroxychromene-2-carboxylate isomerase